MKQVILSILVLFGFMLSGCGFNLPSVPEEKSSLNENVSIYPIKFDKLTAYFGISKNSDVGYDRYLFFYGTIGTTEKDNNRLSEIYRQKYIQIDFYSKNDKLYSSQDLDWTFSDLNYNEKNFTLAVPYSIETTENDVNFDKIILQSKEGKQAFDVGNYHIGFFNTAETKKLSCVESPLLMQYPDVKLNLSYAVMMTEKTDNSEYDFHLEAGDSSCWKIENIEWDYDEELTNQLKEEYSSIKTEKELEYLKVYRINVCITLPSKIDIAIKPIISAKIDGENVYCTAEPFFLKF
ncbi:MAG TPA: hypothetical protein PLM59_02320 [Oscillospiraceae bacterium]|nr:hypothetical protein [Oscillospiraceae bacterium]